MRLCKSCKINILQLNETNNLFFILLLFGCQEVQSPYESLSEHHSIPSLTFDLVTEGHIEVHVDDETINKSRHIQFVDIEKEGHLFLYNHNIKALDFYKLADSAFLNHRISLPKGSKSIYRQISGFYIPSLDSTHLFDGHSYGFKVINSSLDVIQEQNVTIADQGFDNPVPMGSTESAVIRLGNSFYQTGISWHHNGENVEDYFESALNIIKTDQNGFHENSIRYPTVYQNHHFHILYEYKAICKTLDGDSLIINFPADPSLYVVDKNLVVNRKIVLKHDFDTDLKSLPERTLDRAQSSA